MERLYVSEARRQLVRCRVGLDEESRKQSCETWAPWLKRSLNLDLGDAVTPE
jgi:hypothetical protein